MTGLRASDLSAFGRLRGGLLLTKEVAYEDYPQPAVERARKIQEIVLEAVGREIPWIEAIDIIGVPDKAQLTSGFQHW